MILLVGADGSMGKRYQAILKFLGKSYLPVDKETPISQLASKAYHCDGAIIATPTDTHEDVIKSIIATRIPILCEKPVTKNIEKLKEIIKQVKAYDIKFKMVFQYRMLARTDCIGKSLYNYFRHGNDGLIWDCMQIINLARTEVTLREESPVWTCVINGKALNIRHMDAAYIEEIRTWFSNPTQDLGWLMDAHLKTKEASVIHYKNSFKEVQL